MENSNLPIRMWYIAMAFMSYSKKGLSAKELQRQLSHKYYEPIWFMMQKLRKSMGQRDALYDLKDMIEFDEAYVETEVPQNIKQDLKRGKGSQRQQNVVVMAESTPLENPQTGKKSEQVRYFKMKVLEGHKSEHINQTISQHFSDKCIRRYFGNQLFDRPLVAGINGHWYDNR